MTTQHRLDCAFGRKVVKSASYSGKSLPKRTLKACWTINSGEKASQAVWLQAWTAHTFSAGLQFLSQRLQRFFPSMQLFFRTSSSFQRRGPLPLKITPQTVIWEQRVRKQKDTRHEGSSKIKYVDILMKFYDADQYARGGFQRNWSREIPTYLLLADVTGEQV